MPQPALNTSVRASDREGTVLVVGAGPVGMRVAQDLAKAGRAVTVLSAEAQPPYNRVRLTPLLSGDVQFGGITLASPEDGALPFDLHLSQRVARIEPDAQRVITADGTVWPYDTLILATGSSAFIPSIPGREKPGVFTFRTADDASALTARSFSARKVAVIGGGLLGLEAARGMRRRQCDVTVIEHESHLMPRQLDEHGGARLSSFIETMDVTVKTGVAVSEILGEHRVEGLRLASGEVVDCDTVIICTGVRPNVDLAREAKISFNRGIMVDDNMRTSAPGIYAVGECVEHAGQVFGLVGPGYAQADAAAADIQGDHAPFDPPAPASKLKVIGADVFSVGNVEQLEVQRHVQSHTWESDTGYRRIFISRGKLVGAIAVGAWEQSSRMQDAVTREATVYPWMLYRFRKTGDFWGNQDVPAGELPDSATLCNCTGVTCGQVRGAMAAGCGTVEEIGEETGAGTVCGTCQPLLSELIDADAPPKPVKFWKIVTGFSAIALLAALVPLLIGAVPLPESYDADSLRVWLWRDNIVKQWTGFILLGLTLAAFTLGLRKRIRFMDRLGAFDGWRLVHLGIGIAVFVGYLIHTGMNLGSGWNAALALAFVLTMIAGALAGLATGEDHELRARRIGSARKPVRRLPTWVHILLLWPLPALIAFHILASYAF